MGATRTEILERELLDLRNELKVQSANEAETRLKLINRVIFEILLWDMKDVTVEVREVEDGKATITDYKFVTATTSFIIEAKRISKPFLDVVGQSVVQLTDANLIGEFGKAVRQARDFCRAAGIPFAGVTNGDSWFIFPAIRTDGVSFAESSGIYFSSLESVLLFDKDAFYSLLSRLAVIDKSLDRALLGTIVNQVEQRRLNAFFESSTPKLERANMFDLVSAEFSTALNPELSSQSKELLKGAYVQTPSRVRFDQRIQMHVRRREPVTQKAALKPMKQPEGRRFLDLLQGALETVRPTAILLLGSVGSGKTTFLEYVYSISGEEYFQRRGDRPYPHWIRINFLPFSEASTPRQFMMQAILKFIGEEPFLSDYERCVKHAFGPEIDALMRGPLRLFSEDTAERKRYITDFLMEKYKLVEPYVLAVLKYAARRSAVYLVIDNVDQIEDQGQQELAFREAMAVAQECGTNLILSMRDATYVRNRNSAAFDAFDFDPVAIEAPPVEAVLSRRFTIAGELVSGRSGEFISDNGAKVEVSDLSTVVDLLRRSVLGTEIGRQIDVLASGNIRLALRMTREFLQYGYSATAKAYRIFSSTGQYQLPPHEALRAIMLGNQSVYREEFSNVGNIFDARLNRTEIQLARLFVLNAIVSHASNSQFQFVSSDDIVQNCSNIGLSEQSLLRVLENLAGLSFVQTLSNGPATLEANFIPTRLGGYIVRHYLANFTYVENTMMDTFVPQDDAWLELKRLSAEILRERRNPIPRLRLRKARALKFFDVMQGLYEPLVTEARKRALPAEWCADPLAAVRPELVRNLERATRSAERIYGGDAGTA